MTDRTAGATVEPRLAHDERGVALIEFALVLPFLVLLYLGGYQLMDAMSVYRKVGSTTRTLADLTTQNISLTPAQADEILNASRQVMAPYSTNNAVLTITQVQTNASSNAKVSWSRALNGTARQRNSAVTLPAGLVQPGKYYIFSEITYTYTPVVAPSLIGTIPLTQSIYMSPRDSTSITYDD